MEAPVSQTRYVLDRNGLHFWNQRGRISQNRVSKINLEKKIFWLHGQFVYGKITAFAPLKIAET